MSTPTPSQPAADSVGALHLTVHFGGGGVDPIPSAARFVLGVGELAEQVAERFGSQAREPFTLAVTGVQAGSSAVGATPAALAVLGVAARTVPGIGHDGLRHLLTRLAEQIATEAGTAARVTVLDDTSADGG